MEKINNVETANIGIDSGRLILIDPCYVELKKEIVDLMPNQKLETLGVVVENFGGDVPQIIKIEKNGNGRTMRLSIDFDENDKIHDENLSSQY